MYLVHVFSRIYESRFIQASSKAEAINLGRLEMMKKDVYEFCVYDGDFWTGKTVHFETKIKEVEGVKQ